MYHSWFSLDGVNDFGDVTLACDDDKRIQAHKVYLATGSVGSSLSSTTGSVGLLGIFGRWFSRLGFLQLFQLESLATVSVGSSLSSTTGSVGLFGIFGRWFSRLLLDGRFGWSN